VAFSVTFQYQITADNLKPCILKYRDFDKWSNVVEAAGTSAVQHTCSEFNISNFQNQRGVIQNRVEENLRMRLEGTEENDYKDGIFALAISLQLRNVELPLEYQQAVSEKQAANEDIQLAINQRTQEVTKANTALLAANEQSRKILDTATNDANVTMTRAMLRAEETLFALETEARILSRVGTNLNLDSNGILSYMANKLYEAVPQLSVIGEEPAKLSRKEEL
jgi:prohibitin 2